MKRLVTLAACLAMLTFTGCANGVLGGGMFSNGCNSGCNSGSSLFGGKSFFSDGPIRQFLRGDACDNCNAAAGQVMPGFAAPSFGSPSCDACGGIPADPFAISSGSISSGPFASEAFPSGAISQGVPMAQPTTSFYPGDAGVSLGQPVLDGSPVIDGSGISPIDPGSLYGGGIGGSIDSLNEPPAGMN